MGKYILFTLKDLKNAGWKMVKEDHELTFFHRHAKITTIYRAIIDAKIRRLAEKYL